MPSIRKLLGIFRKEKEEDLLKNLQSKDNRTSGKAIEYIMENYQKDVYNYLRGKGCYDERIMKDIFYDTLSSLMENRLELQLKYAFSTIIIAFAKNRWRTRLKHIIKDRKSTSMEDLLKSYERHDSDDDNFWNDGFDLKEYVFDDDLFYEIDHDESEMTFAVRVALKQLKGKHCRDIYQMEFYDRLTQQEIAEDLGLTREHVNSLKKGKCMEELEAILREKGIRLPKREMPLKDIRGKKNEQQTKDSQSE